MLGYEQIRYGAGHSYIATWNWCTCTRSDRLPELLRNQIRLVDQGESLQAEREKRTCSGSRDSPGGTRDKGGGAGLNFGFWSWTTVRAATVNAAAVGAAAEEEADPEALGGGDTP